MSEKVKIKKSDAVFYAALALAVLAVIIFRIVFNNNFAIVEVNGSSMKETLLDGDFIYAKYGNDAQRGDIVVLDVAKYNGEGIHNVDFIIKRLIAEEGDSLYSQNGQIFIKYSGESEYVLLNEEYVSSLTPDFKEVMVGENEIFCLGDNRAVSNDSTEFGCYKIDDVYGVVPDWSINIKSFTTKIYNVFY